MHPNLFIAFATSLLMACDHSSQSQISLETTTVPGIIKSFAKVEEIPLPQGFRRISLDKGSFGEWLRNIAIKSDNTVFLYNGSKKRNQSAQFAVLDISVGDKDLQQCADAVMRLRAEYLLAANRSAEIVFRDNNGKEYRAPRSGNRTVFDKYLEQVFSWCGTISLEKQLKPVSRISSIQPGDVFIKGGSPGHAAIVMDVAVNASGERLFLLANSYMPAQDIHIVLNPATPELSPWYSIGNSSEIKMPEWTFNSFQLRSW